MNDDKNQGGSMMGDAGMGGDVAATNTGAPTDTTGMGGTPADQQPVTRDTTMQQPTGTDTPVGDTAEPTAEPTTENPSTDPTQQG